MAFIGSNPKFNTGTLNPQSADPANPVEGMLHYSDGTARTEGVYVYKNSAWSRIAEGTAGSLSVRTETSNYTAVSSDDLILADATSGALTITLPPAASNSGKVYTIKKIDSSANAVTIDGNASETIDGSTTQVLYTEDEAMNIVSDGTNFVIRSKHEPDNVAYVKDVKAGSTNGGTFTSGAWRTRDLNTVEGNTSLVSVSSNQFTIPAGTWDIEVEAPAFLVANNVLRLRNITDSTTDLEGQNARANADAQVNAIMKGQITILSSKTYEIQHRGTLTRAADGFGNPDSLSSNSIFTIVKLTKRR